MYCNVPTEVQVTGYSVLQTAVAELRARIGRAWNREGPESRGPGIVRAEIGRARNWEGQESGFRRAQNREGPNK